MCQVISDIVVSIALALVVAKDLACVATLCCLPRYGALARALRERQPQDEIDKLQNRLRPVDRRIDAMKSGPLRSVALLAFAGWMTVTLGSLASFFVASVGRPTDSLLLALGGQRACASCFISSSHLSCAWRSAHEAIACSIFRYPGSP